MVVDKDMAMANQLKNGCGYSLLFLIKYIDGIVNQW